GDGGAAAADPAWRGRHAATAHLMGRPDPMELWGERTAFPGWSGASPEVRADLLHRVGTTILERREAIGRLLAREEGKTLAEATGEAARAGRIFKYFAGEAVRRPGQSLDSVRPGGEGQTYREALRRFRVDSP